MKKLGIIILVIVAICIVGYGGYKVIHHFTKSSIPAQTMTTKVQISPTTEAMKNNIFKMTSSAKLGSYLTDSKGMTLYTYTKDTVGISNCAGNCLAIWPAYSASSQAGTYPTNISVIKRTDGALQYAWKGMPLYYFSQDKNPGDTKGQGIGGIWYVAK